MTKIVLLDIFHTKTLIVFPCSNLNDVENFQRRSIFRVILNVVQNLIQKLNDVENFQLNLEHVQFFNEI